MTDNKWQPPDPPTTADGFVQPTTSIDVRLFFAEESMSVDDRRAVIDTIRAAYDWSYLHVRAVQEIERSGELTELLKELRAFLVDLSGSSTREAWAATQTRRIDALMSEVFGESEGETR